MSVAEDSHMEHTAGILALFVVYFNHIIICLLIVMQYVSWRRWSYYYYLFTQKRKADRYCKRLASLGTSSCHVAYCMSTANGSVIQVQNKHGEK